ncbi:hypothetical protein KP509_23G020000 [Ceratopteris richardii]|nr:hypothetical protein KP509_23G020000 [Ceratopteris richardii]
MRPKLRKSFDEWAKQSFSFQGYKNLAMSTVICGCGSIEATVSCQVPVHDAVAPPSVRVRNYRVAPRTLAYKARRTKRKLHRGGGDGDDDGPEWDEGGFGGSGGWGGSDGGRDGNGNWGSDWHEDGWWWEDASEAAFSFIYELACWVSLTQCSQFALKKVIDAVHSGVNDSPVDAGSFGQCSWLFMGCKSGGMPSPSNDCMPRLMWPPV